MVILLSRIRREYKNVKTADTDSGQLKITKSFKKGEFKVCCMCLNNQNRFKKAHDSLSTHTEAHTTTLTFQDDGAFCVDERFGGIQVRLAQCVACSYLPIALLPNMRVSSRKFSSHCCLFLVPKQYLGCARLHSTPIWFRMFAPTLDLSRGCPE